jgi:hypothetical protein
MGSFRSTMFHRFRHDCCFPIYGPTLASEITNDREDSELLKIQLGYNNGEWDIMRVRLLYPEDATDKQFSDPVYRRDNLFRSEILMRVRRILLTDNSSV